MQAIHNKVYKVCEHLFSKSLKLKQNRTQYGDKLMFLWLKICNNCRNVFIKLQIKIDINLSTDTVYVLQKLCIHLKTWRNDKKRRRNKYLLKS